MGASKFFSFTSPLIVIAAACFYLSVSRAQTVPASTPVPVSPAPSVRAPVPLARCGEITNLGPEFGMLGKACEYVAAKLPDIVCREDQELFSRYSDANGETGWKKISAMRADVAFVSGMEEEYSNVTYNGFRVHELDTPHTGTEVMAYLLKKYAASGTYGAFGGDLYTLFAQRSQATFSYLGKSSVQREPFTLFGFEISGERNSSSCRILPPGRVCPGLQGVISVDASGSLRRVEIHDTGYTGKFAGVTAASSAKYNTVNIANIGPVLLPTDGEFQFCTGRERTCDRLSVTFHYCHKFAGKSRIVQPSSVPR